MLKHIPQEQGTVLTILSRGLLTKTFWEKDSAHIGIFQQDFCNSQGLGCLF